MKKISTLLLLSTAFFLSTFFVGCKPQENPIALEDIGIKHHKNVVEKVKPIEKPVEIEKQQFPENQTDDKNTRLVIVNVTAESKPVTNATVTLKLDKTIEKQTDSTGVAKFSLPNDVRFILLSAYNDDYAVVNYFKPIDNTSDVSPITVDLVLKEKGVIITAILKNAPERIKNFKAAIVEAHPKGFPKIFISTTNIAENKIIFPAVPTEFDELHVSIAGDNIPVCCSEIFGTTDGEDKEIIIEIPEKVTLKGTAFLPTGLPVTGIFNATIMPVSDVQTGQVYKKAIQPDFAGGYEISSLAPGFFKISFNHKDYNIFNTNLYLSSPETELNFSFSEIAKLTLRGKVINGFDKSPIEGVTVFAESSKDQTRYDKDVTNLKGEFSLELKECDFSKNYYGTLIIDEPGFGKVRKSIYNVGPFATITIPLWAAGNITGKITDKNGHPISGMIVEADNDNYLPVVKTVSQINASDNQLRYSSCPSDINGVYAISNVAAPMKYGIKISNFSNLQRYSTSRDAYSVKVEPGKTAICDLVVQQPVIIAVKVRDENNNPVLNYSIDYELHIDSWSRSGNDEINFSEDKWKVLDSSGSGAGEFSCSVFNEEKMLGVRTNNIPIAACGTNYITLLLSKTEPNISGYLTKADGNPVSNGSIGAWPEKSRMRGPDIQVKVDSSGFFRIMGLDVKKGEMLKVAAWDYEDSSTLHTNIPAGSQNVEFRFTKPKKITGHVFFDDLNSPASNFFVECSSIFGGAHSFSPTDGTFSFKLKSTSSVPKYLGAITVSAENYLPEKKKFDLTNKSVFDVGNIILKYGKTANVQGKLLNQYGKPVEQRVYLKYKNSGEKLSALASLEDGVYVFEGLKPGKATVSAKTWHGFSASYSFDINEGDNLELPDLVLNYTNSAFVVLTFKLPNGSFVRNTTVINNGYRIYFTGELIRDIHTGIYSDWKIKYNGKTYLADKFEITEETDKLEIWLREE